MARQVRGNASTEVAAALRAIAKRARGSQPVFALFTGSDRKAISEATSAIAREAGLELTRIGLGALVSKYVGETEKNLDQVFADAERRRAILVFDEADALFDERSEGGAPDGNQVVGFVCKRKETFAGLMILILADAGTMAELARKCIDYELAFDP